MTLLASLLRDFGDVDRGRLLALINKSIVDERAAVAAGATPRRGYDVGPRLRRTRLRPAAPRADIRLV
ncbi:hypothetical protein CC117_09355 [Parafrankia colletiae]|uniref:Uncharacterized protein n=1 Tax=Parafrankia colletiae TaxID=573497 RepID=A0A1S1RIT3_9ACTN|nr:hypothetical protein [Parafrankia colletiae]MCK9899286.1 hypothetical protein [Frankia sp. Cpl3]OHV45947.1 hypothetical protein CC117_09355 [Parafrankia colletiae]